MMRRYHQTVVDSPLRWIQNLGLIASIGAQSTGVIGEQIEMRVSHNVHAVQSKGGVNCGILPLLDAILDW